MVNPCLPKAQGGKTWMSDAQWLERHAELLAEVKANPGAQLLFVGDSITQGWRNHPELFNAHFGKYQPANIGIGGDETQHVLWRLEHGGVDGLSPKAIVLLLGTNNIGNSGMTGEETAPGVAAVLDALRLRMPAAKILLLAPFPRDPEPGMDKRKQVVVLNRLLAGMHDGKQVFFLDLAEKFLSPDGTLSPHLFPDYLHLSAEAYAIWAKEISPVIDRWMRE